MKSTKIVKEKVSVSQKIVDAAIEGLQEKKGENIVLLDLRNVSNAVCDFFIIAQGTSRTQVEALANSVDEYVKKHTGEDPWHAEGYTNGEWILLDYINVVVHVFQPEAREFFKLEKLWGDAEITSIN